MNDSFQKHCYICRRPRKFAHHDFLPKEFNLENGSCIKYWTKSNEGSKEGESSVKVVELKLDEKSKRCKQWRGFSEVDQTFDFLPKVFILENESSGNYWCDCNETPVKDTCNVERIKLKLDKKSKAKGKKNTYKRDYSQVQCLCDDSLSKLESTRKKNKEQTADSCDTCAQSILNITNCDVYFSCSGEDQYSREAQNLCMYPNCPRSEDEEVKIKCVMCLSTYHSQCALRIKDLIVLSPNGYVDCCSQRGSIKNGEHPRSFQ